MGKATPKHIHKIVKSGPVWKCAFSDCYFFVYPKQEYVLNGRASFCWSCGNKFPLDDEALEEDMPRCTKCRNPEIAPVAEAMSEAQEEFPMNTSLSHDEMRKKLIAMGVLHE